MKWQHKAKIMKVCANIPYGDKIYKDSTERSLIFHHREAEIFKGLRKQYESRNRTYPRIYHSQSLFFSISP